MNRNDETSESTRRGGRLRGQPRRVGRFRIEGELGRGGMGVVHRAFDERLHRPVALKALPAELAADPAELARLEDEARALARVQHPHVAMIFGLEEADGTRYLVLELVLGETLGERLERGPLAIAEATTLAIHLADGLDAIHRKGLVHRDLKPRNVMLTPDGVAKILDFGIAKDTTSSPGRVLSEPDTVTGTPGFMSPEQLRGEVVDARCDAWAWGCLLFECLAGEPPFWGATAAECNAATLEREPTWESLPGATPPGLVDLLRSCLSKDREGRPQTMADVRRVLEHVAGTPAGDAAARVRHSLPAQRDEFVGRGAELQELGRLIGAGHRLVSVLGLGGMGKTRLVVRHAWTCLDRLPGGAWFCDLSEARDADGIVRAVAAALDVPLGRGGDIVQLGHAIAGRGKCLVILDNFEQVARHAPETLGKWLDRASEAQFIVTTREVLGLPGETSFALAPLHEDDAMQLFAARAVQAKRDFVLGAAERPHVQALVRLLDAMPLAIELAAARVLVMPPKALLQRMSERFKLLTSSGGRHTRQATLRATLDWSWDLLSPDEQQALAQLSVFEGGFTLESAEAVLSLAETWAADVVQALVAKSLVRRVGDERFDLLVSVQEYAAEKLEMRGGRTDAEARHGAHFATHGTDVEIDAPDVHDRAARGRAMVLELDNLVAACRRAVAREDGDVAVATLDVASALLLLRGPLAIGAELAAGVLGLPTLGPGARGRAALARGTALQLLGRGGEAGVCLDTALAAAREAADRRLEGRVLGSMGLLHLDLGRLDEARTHYHASREVARELADRRSEGIVLGSLGHLHFAQGRMDEARSFYDAALAVHREVRNRRSEGVSLGNLGLLHFQQGRMEEARSFYDAALVAAREVGDRRHEGSVLGNMGVLCDAQGRSDEARVWIDEALALARDVGNRRLEGQMLGAMGDLHHDQGRADAALASYVAALAVHREVGNRHSEGWVLGTLGGLHREQGRLGEARECFAAAETILRELGYDLGLGFLLCDRARLEHDEGLGEVARETFAEAERLAAQVGAGPDSGLGKKLEAVRTVLDGGPP